LLIGVISRNIYSWSQWSRSLRRRSAASCLLRLWFRVPPGVWMSVCCECCVLSGKGLCDGLITRLEEPCRLWCILVWDLEASSMTRPWPAFGRSAIKKIYQMTFTKKMKTDLYRGIDGFRIFKCYAMSSDEQLQTWGGLVSLSLESSNPRTSNPGLLDCVILKMRVLDPSTSLISETFNPQNKNGLNLGMLSTTKLKIFCLPICI
jgi:hypothetical protein